MRLIKIKNTHKKTVLIVDADSIMAVEERDGFDCHEYEDRQG